MHAIRTQAQRAKTATLRFLDAGLDPLCADPDLLRRVRTLTFALCLLSVLSPIYAVVNWLFVSRAFGAFIGSLLVASVGTLLWLRRSHSVYMVAQVVTALLFTPLCGSAWLGEGQADPAMTWLLIVPLASALWTGIRPALGWMLLCALVVAGFHVADQFGLRPADRVHPDARFLHRLVGQVLALPVVLGVAGAFLAAQRRLEESLRSSYGRIQELALVDPLTNLANRRAFLGRLRDSIAAAADRQQMIAVLFLDLDGFKNVNDALGHAVGDSILREVALRLRACVRSDDTIGRIGGDGPAPDLHRPHETSISRLGGDEFTLVVERLKRSEDAARLARRINLALERPFAALDREVYMRASIGIALYPRDGHDADSLVRRADLAMYEAKSRGRNGFCFYAGDLDRVAQQRVQIEGRLRYALEHRKLTLHFQPICDAQEGHTLAAEALLRWTDGELGEVSPGSFLPVAEQCGLSREIDRFVLDQACRTIRGWQTAGFRPVRVSVNVSSRTLREYEFADEVARTIRQHCLTPDLFELEITESSVMTEDSTTRSNVAALSEHGIGIVLDDFGTGFSSLSHLRNFPVDRLKVDRSFVAGLGRSPHDRSLVEFLVSLARSLRVGVVAEGVETESQLKALRALGCDAIQGWLISKAVPADEFVRFLEPEKGGRETSASEAREP